MQRPDPPDAAADGAGADPEGADPEGAVGEGAVRDAAAVALLREGKVAGGVEVLLLERHSASPFAPGALVFPGGALAVEDGTTGACCCAGREDAAASALLGVESGGLAFYAAAARECFEESGVLLAVPRRAARRASPASRSARFADLLAAEGLAVAAGALECFSRWVTPEGRRRRYDTRFFAARMPAGQHAVPDGREVVAALWLRPGDALAGARSGELAMLLPTLAQLEWLAWFASCEEVLAAAARRAASGPEPAIRPVAAGVKAGRMRVRIDGVEHDAGPARLAT